MNKGGGKLGFLVYVCRGLFRACRHPFVKGTVSWYLSDSCRSLHTWRILYDLGMALAHPQINGDERDLIRCLPEPSLEGSPSIGIGTCSAGCTIGLEGETRGLRAAGVSPRRKRPLGTVLFVHEGRRCAGLFLLSYRVSETDRNG